jgi:DNA-binding transcriptional MerR regulator
MLGVPVATIRTWEDRYGLVVPDRNASGHRLYRRGQVESLRFVRARMAEGASEPHSCGSSSGHVTHTAR